MAEGLSAADGRGRAVPFPEFGGRRLTESEQLVRSAYQQGREAGVRSVTHIRCREHAEIPQQQFVEPGGPECALCVLDDVMRHIGPDVLALVAAIQRAPVLDGATPDQRDAIRQAVSRLSTVFRVRHAPVPAPTPTIELVKG